MSDPARRPLITGAGRIATSGWTAIHARADGARIGEVAEAGPEDVDRAVRAADAAWPAWAALPPPERARALSAYAALVDAHQADLADLVHRETGKPLPEAQAEVARAAEVIHHFAGEAERMWTRQMPGASLGTGSWVRPAPLGVVAAITPWNFPVALVVWKLAPALAAGCAVVVKPAIEAPLAAWALCDLAERSGLPAGLVSCLTGDGPLIGEALSTHPQVAKVAFTGSRRVAEQIAAWASPRLKALSLELGGHGALVVMPDADLDVAAEVATVQGYVNSGQACYAVNRVLVPPGLRDGLLERMRARIADISLGPMTTDRGLARHHMLLEEARGHDGVVVEGGQEVAPGRLSPALVTGAGPGRAAGRRGALHADRGRDGGARRRRGGRRGQPARLRPGQLPLRARPARRARDRGAAALGDGGDQRLAGGAALRALRRLAGVGGRLRARAAGARGLRPLAAPARPLLARCRMSARAPAPAPP